MDIIDRRDTVSKLGAVPRKVSQSIVACFLLLTIRPAVVAAQANDVTVGVNLVNAPYSLTAAEQASILQAMQRGEVRVIRGAIPGPKGVEWADRVHAKGIKMLWLVDLAYTEGTTWPHMPRAGYYK